MADGEEAQVSEAQIAVHWREEEYHEPPASFVAGKRRRSDFGSSPSCTSVR